MHASKPTPAPIAKGNSFRKFQRSWNKYEIDQMNTIPYASVIKSLQYAQVCTLPHLAFVTGILGRYQDNLGIEHWRMVKKAKAFMLCARHKSPHADIRKI
jgi:hypothetical protein